MEKIEDQEKFKFIGKLPNLTCKNQHIFTYNIKEDKVEKVDITTGKVSISPDQKVCYASNKKNAIRKLLGKDKITKYLKK